MFKRLGALEKSGGGLNVSFLNTHPASDERVKVQSYSMRCLLLITGLLDDPMIRDSNLKLCFRKHSPFKPPLAAEFRIT